MTGLSASSSAVLYCSMLAAANVGASILLAMQFAAAAALATSVWKRGWCMQGWQVHSALRPTSSQLSAADGQAAAGGAMTLNCSSSYIPPTLQVSASWTAFRTRTGSAHRAILRRYGLAMTLLHANTKFDAIGSREGAAKTHSCGSACPWLICQASVTWAAAMTCASRIHSAILRRCDLVMTLLPVSTILDAIGSREDAAKAHEDGSACLWLTCQASATWVAAVTSASHIHGAS